MSDENLKLTEHAIKRHAKRLQKQMKNYNQDLSLGESQNLLSKILGFNDWNHLNTILKPAMKEHEKDNKLLISIKNSLYTRCAIISSSDLICKSISLFLGKSEILGDYYICEIFENVSSYQNFIKNNKQKFNFIIYDSDFNDQNLNKQTDCPIIYLVNEKKEEIFYRLILKLFYANKFVEAIEKLKKYINENKGQVDHKLWKLLLCSYQRNSNNDDFNKTALIYSNKFNLEENINFDNFSFIPENNYNNYFLSKPFSKEDLFKIIHFADYFK